MGMCNNYCVYRHTTVGVLLLREYVCTICMYVHRRVALNMYILYNMIIVVTHYTINATVQNCIHKYVCEYILCTYI